MRKLILLIALSFFSIACFSQSTDIKTGQKKKILVHITHGPEDPTRAALGFLVARTAIEEGHSVTMFLAGDAVNLIKDSVINTLTGIGTGKLKEHFAVILASDTRIYLSGNSSKARGVTDKDIVGKHTEFALPKALVHLAVESDKMFTY